MTLRPAVVDPSVPNIVPARVKSGTAKTFSSIYSGFEEHRQPKAARPEHLEKRTDGSQDAVVVTVAQHAPPPVRLERSFGLPEIIEDTNGQEDTPGPTTHSKASAGKTLSIDQSESIPSSEQLHRALRSNSKQPAGDTQPSSRGSQQTELVKPGVSTHRGAQETLRGEPVTVQGLFAPAPDSLALSGNTQESKQAVSQPGDDNRGGTQRSQQQMNALNPLPSALEQLNPALPPSTKQPGDDNQGGAQRPQHPVAALDSQSLSEPSLRSASKSTKQLDGNRVASQGPQQPAIALAPPSSAEQLHGGLTSSTKQPDDNQAGTQEQHQPVIVPDSLASAAEQQHPVLQSTMQLDDNLDAAEGSQQAVGTLDSLPSLNPKEQLAAQTDAIALNSKAATNQLRPGDSSTLKDSESSRLAKLSEEADRRPETAFAVRLTDASPVIAPASAAVNQPTTDASPKSTPAAAPPEVPAEPTKPAESKAVNEVSFRVNGADDASAVIRVVERSGAIHVSVHTAEPELTASLRANVNELKERLETDGRQAEIWKPPSGNEDTSQHRRRGQRFDWIDALEKSA